MALELQQLRQVLALAEHGSFVRAAASLHISQPALSRSIQNLERRFGSDLFVRSSSGALPTDLGRLYVERARDVLRMADELDQEAVSHGKLRTGRVAVGGGPYPADTVLGRAAAKFIEQYPGVGVKVQARDWDELARQLRSRELDFFVAETSTLHREPDLEVMPMAAEHPVYWSRAPGILWPGVAACRSRTRSNGHSRRQDGFRRGSSTRCCPRIEPHRSGLRLFARSLRSNATRSQP